MAKATSSKKSGRGDHAASNVKKRKFKPEAGKKSSERVPSVSNKKRALKHERQSHRRHADVVVAAKELWNKLRLKSNSKEEVKEMMKELMELLRGKVTDLTMQHDASRVVQAAVQFGNVEQRAEIVKELGGDRMAEASKVQYAHFVILKIIKYCYKDDACVKIVTKSFKGQMSKLAVHAVGARVVEFLFATFPPKSTALLKLELYGPQFALFSSGEFSNATSNHPTLQKVLENQPDKRSVALEHVFGLVNKGLEKSLCGFAYFQQLLHEYIALATPNEIRSIAPSIVDHSIHLLSTRHGALVVAECAAYGTPKDRKRIMKSLKGYTRSSLLHRDAYIALLRVIDVTDDTFIVNKSILAELQENPDDADQGGDKDDEGKKSPVLDLALSETGSKLFLLLLSEDDKLRRRYFDPTELEVLRPNPFVMEGEEEVPTSKKAFSIRREELLQYVRKLLTEVCVRHSKELLRSISGSKVLREFFRSFPSDDIATAIVDACSESVEQNEDENKKDVGELKNEILSIFEDPVGHLALKHLLLDESEFAPDIEHAALLAKTLHSKFKGNLMQIASSNRGAFVVGALAKVDCVKKDVLSELKTSKSQISKLSKGEGGKAKSMAGFEALLNLIK